MSCRRLDLKCISLPILFDRLNHGLTQCLACNQPAGACATGHHGEHHHRHIAPGYLPVHGPVKALGVDHEHQYRADDQAECRTDQTTDETPDKAFSRDHGTQLTTGVTQMHQHAKFPLAAEHLGTETAGDTKQADANRDQLQPACNGEAAVKNSEGCRTNFSKS